VALGAGTAGHITLKADATAAECTDVPVCVQGFVAINFVVKIGYASADAMKSSKALASAASQTTRMSSE